MDRELPMAGAVIARTRRQLQRQSRTNAGQDRPDTRITISTVTVPWHPQPLTLPPGR